MVTDEADSADALHQHRGLPERVALDEFLESAELDDMQLGVDDVVVVVELDGDLAVSLDAGDGIDDRALCSRAAPRVSHNDSASGAVDRAAVDQIVEHREDGVRAGGQPGMK